MDDDTPLPGYGVKGNVFVYEMVIPKTVHDNMFDGHRFSTIMKTLFISTVIEIILSTDIDRYEEMVTDAFENKLLYYRLFNDTGLPLGKECVINEHIDSVVIYINMWVKSELKDVGDNMLLKYYTNRLNKKHDSYIITLYFVLET